MARVLRFDELMDYQGQVVCEEWIYGSRVEDVKPITRATDNLILIERVVGQNETYADRRNKDFRYWDSPPTQKEREVTAWP